MPFFAAAILAVFVFCGVFFALLARPQLGIFIAAAERDPLFSRGEIDRIALEKGIALLGDREQRFNAAAGRDRSYSLYPYDFLRSLGITSDALRHFRNFPSARTGRTLTDAWRWSALAYRDRVRQRGRMLERITVSLDKNASLGPGDGIEEDFRNHRLVFPGGHLATSLGILLADNALAQENAGRLLRDVRRRACLLETRLSCSGEKIIAALTLLYQLTHSREPPRTVVAEGVPALPRDILFADDWSSMAKVSRLYAISTFCFNPTGTPRREIFILGTGTNSNGKSLTIPKLATNSFYLTPGPSFYSTLHNGTAQSYFRYLTERGWRHFYQLETTVYMCPAFEHVLALYSAVRGGDGRDLAGVGEALEFIGRRGITFLARYSAAEEESYNSAQSMLFLLATKSPFALNFFNHVPAVWRIKKQPRYILRGRKPTLPPVVLESFTDLARQRGAVTAAKYVKELKSQGWWLAQYAASRVK